MKLVEGKTIGDVVASNPASIVILVVIAGLPPPLCLFLALQLRHVAHVIHNMSLPMSITIYNSVGGVPNFTFFIVNPIHTHTHKTVKSIKPNVNVSIIR